MTKKEKELERIKVVVAIEVEKDLFNNSGEKLLDGKFYLLQGKKIKTLLVNAFVTGKLEGLEGIERTM